MAKGMRSHSLAGQRWRLPGRSRDMQIEAMGESVPSHGPTPCVEEQEGVVHRRANVEPLAHHRPCLLPQRQRALAPSLADHLHRGQIRLCEAVERQRRQLRDPQAGSEAEIEHRPVADSCRCREVRRIKEGLHLRVVEPVDDRGVGAFTRQGAHLQRHVEIGRSPVLEVAEQGLDPRQADVARRDAIVALVLERFEEGEDRRDREILDLQHTGANAALSGDEQDEQLEAVGVAGDGMAADAALLRQVIVQKGREVWGEVSHGRLLW